MQQNTPNQALSPDIFKIFINKFNNFKRLFNQADEARNLPLGMNADFQPCDEAQRLKG